MRALAITRRPDPGTLPDAIQMLDLANPAPAPREVIVRVLASSINIDDIHVAEGTFYGGIPLGPRPKPERPVTPGSDLAGIITAIGRDVRSLRPGQAVFGVHVPYRANGAWAELCPVDERWLASKPRGLSFDAAAACGVSGLVALSAIQALHLRPGQRVVIVGATGGIGGMAAQLASRAGAEVIGICGPDSMDLARRLGCAAVFDYHSDPWDRALVAAGIAPAEGVLDTVGGRDVEESARRILSPHGLFVTVVGPERFVGDRALGWAGVLSILARVGFRILRSRIHGPRYILTGPSAGAGKALPEVAAAAESGVLPPIDSVVPFELEPMRQALRRAESHQNHGRIVIEMDHAA